MSWPIFAKSIEIAQSNNITKINFFGGEPLLNPHIFDMLKYALERNLDLMLATNCQLLANNDFFAEFIDVTGKYKKRFVIFTPRDRFHLKFFDPADVANELRKAGYNTIVQYTQVVVLSKYNTGNQELHRLNNRGSCCNLSWEDNLGILPDGAWAICPASLEPFGNISLNSLKDIVKFKRELPLRFKEGCTECLKDFGGFRTEFEKVL
jgi:MoaA/NifB/PqqE/SkfB family radical SAM enzyme